MKRRTFLSTALSTGLAASSLPVILPYAARAAAHSGDVFATAGGGEITVHPVSHASFVMTTPMRVIYNDPVGGAALYTDFDAPDLVIITHHHGDHFDAETLAAIVADKTDLIVNPTVHEQLPEALKAKAHVMANGDNHDWKGMTVDAVPAYNLTEERLKYHPPGRDNGYVLTIDGTRIYIAGDTEGTPELRAMQDITLAFVPMNLPYTMDVTQAADAVADFAPSYVYPYHYRDSDPQEFARLLGQTGAATEVRLGPWYDDAAHG
ncbi:MBL fold metallo-hydrolase [Pseudooceanicola aestuarii]|uniref:MBL fold metallo-hydrolase n=1 Tax=Pseudooceanicola aestuarii TaxID=2697319 RepID=UPI0013D4E2DC|nr:MBL fold metallo-hydrolase [Pseudooceanicola aestuarii]